MFVLSLNSSKPLRLQRGLLNPVVLAKGVATVLLVAWMAVSLSTVLIRLLPQPTLNEANNAADPSHLARPETVAAPAVDISSLKAITLFGDALKSDPVTTEPEPLKEDVEETRLNLELVGSFASDDQDQAYAIIANGKKQELYRVNQEVAGLNNVKLRRVFADKVILDNKGRQEALLMYPDGKPITSGTFVSNQLSSGPAQSNTAARALSGLNDNQRLEKISDAIRFSRKTRDGKMVGFRVLPGRNREAFEQTGLQLNDIVTAIDGQVLDNLRAANQIYQEKRNATQASLTVLRGEEEITIDVDLNNINL